MAPARLLAVCTLPPWPVRDGYSLRVANVLQQLAEQWDVTLLSPGTAPPGMRHIGMALDGPGLTYPWRFDNRALVAGISTALAGRPDRALIWPGAEDAWLRARDTPPAVLDMIDCNVLEFWRAAKAAGPLRGRIRAIAEAVIALRHGRRAVRGFAATVCVGGADAAWMSRVGGRAVSSVPNGVDLPELSGVPDARPTILFAGTLDYGPNIDAVAFVAAAIWPRIRAATPGARWVIAGRRPVAAIRALHGVDSVEVRPDVPDMAAEHAAAWVAIAPMRIGVGLKNKVLDAWASARPVVMTPLATNGLTMPRCHDSLVVADAPQFAQVVVSLLRDEPLRRRLGDTARDFAAQEFAWKRTADDFDRLLREGLA